MAPLELQGSTLGEKHKCYNELLKEVFEKKSLETLSNIDYDESDLDNIFKIDIASLNQNVVYILEVLKCEDMLYISKAIKQSLWLITDEKYAHIVNPEYLHSQLFPQMTSKAINKFTLYIRLNLKNENRVESFFNYYKNDDIQVALKWLANCSLQFILNAVKTYADKITVHILKRLCKQSVTVLEVYIKERKQCYKRNEVNATTFLINKHFDKYLDLLENLKDYDFPDLGAKTTKIIMKRAPHRILSNFEKYAENIHLPTFVKYLKPENVKNFLLKHHKNEKLQNWFCHYNLRPFILVMPQENRLKFVKMLLINKNRDDISEECEDETPDYTLCCTGGGNPFSCPNSYTWYKYVPFKSAFLELHKLIRAESSPSERISMLEVLLYSAGRNMQHIQTLLQYFRNKHINEPFKFKIKFINAMLKQIRGFRLVESNWQNLNELFCSMDVYSESKNNVQFCVTVAIVHKIIYNETIPEILENKFSFDTLKEYQEKTDKKESEQIFNYLYNYTTQKIKIQNIASESEFIKGVNLVENLLKLLSDWKKDLLDFPLVLTIIQELIRIKKINSWNVNLSCLYNTKKSWKKHLFAISLDLCPSQEACVNALKHDPKLILTSKNVLESLYCDDKIILKQYLNKIRTYWFSSLARENISFFLDQINRRSDNKALIRNLFVLMPQKECLDVVKRYVPKEEKINWNENDKVLLDLQKNIAKFIHIVRPLVSLEVVLWYAKGDYLQFTIPSLMALLYNLNCTNIKKHIKVLIEAPVSLQKHGIRTAINHLKSEEVIQIFENAWKSTKNRSIRTDLFNSTFKLLCKEKKVSTIETIWRLLCAFIDTLTDEENKAIYYTLAKVDQVPLCVRVAFWKKSFQFLKTLPPKCNCDSLIQRVISSAREFMDIIDVDFIAEILLENFRLNLTTGRFDHGVLISSCLFSVENSESQLKRYKKIFLPIMELCVKSWNKKHKNEYVVRSTYCELLKKLCQDFKNVVIEKENVIPSIIFQEILQYLEHNLPVEENYTLLRTWTLVSTLINILNENILIKTDNEIKEVSRSNMSDTHSETLHNYFNTLISRAIPKFGEELLQYVKKDMKLFYPSIYLRFGESLKLMLGFFSFDDSSELHILKSLLNTDIIESYLVVLNLIPKHIPDEQEAQKSEIINLIRSHPSPEIKIQYNCYNEKSYLNNL